MKKLWRLIKKISYLYGNKQKDMTLQDYKEQIGISRYEVHFEEGEYNQLIYQVYDNYSKEYIGKPYKYQACAYRLQGTLEQEFMYGK